MTISQAADYFAKTYYQENTKEYAIIKKAFIVALETVKINLNIDNLGIALRMIGMDATNEELDKIIDISELVMTYGDQLNIEQIVNIQKEWEE